MVRRTRTILRRFEAGSRPSLQRVCWRGDATTADPADSALAVNSVATSAASSPRAVSARQLTPSSLHHRSKSSGSRSLSGFSRAFFVAAWLPPSPFPSRRFAARLRAHDAAITRPMVLMLPVVVAEGELVQVTSAVAERQTW